MAKKGFKYQQVLLAHLNLKILRHTVLIVTTSQETCFQDSVSSGDKDQIVGLLNVKKATNISSMESLGSTEA